MCVHNEDSKQSKNIKQAYTMYMYVPALVLKAGHQIMSGSTFYMVLVMGWFPPGSGWDWLTFMCKLWWLRETRLYNWQVYHCKLFEHNPVSGSNTTVSDSAKSYNW